MPAAAAPSPGDVVTFALSSVQAGDVVVVRVCGDLDVGTAAALSSHVSGLIDRGQRRILIDCTELTFLDCSGLGALLRCSRAAGLHGGWLQLSKVSVTVLRLLTLTGLAQALVSEDEIPAVMAGREPATSRSDAPR